jgi:hypothetical protein
LKVTAFGAHEAGGVVAFDVASGRELARLALEGPLLDLVWDSARSRLLAAVQEPVLDAARVVQLSWDGAALSVVHRSEPFTGDVRVHTDAASTLALSREMGTTWTPLDDSLGAEGLGKHLYTPAGLVGVPAGDRLTWLGLDASAFEDGDDADALVSVTFKRVWSTERWLLPAPGRPASLLVHAPGLDEAWLVRQWPGTARAQLGEVLTVSPAVPELAGVALPSPGSLEGAVPALSPDALVLLEAGDSGLSLVALPLHGGEPAAVPLDGGIDRWRWLPRNPVSDAARALVVVATSAGARAFRVRGTSELPALGELEGSLAASVRPPLALLTP